MSAIPASLTLSSGELQTLRRIANGGAVISLLRAADVARFKKLNFIECGAIRVHLTERGRAFLAKLEVGSPLFAPGTTVMGLKAKGKAR